ncbi:MAG: ATP-binding protein [Acidimicrobiia bacterium]
METSLLIFGILVAGLVLGSTARFVIPGRQSFTIAETTLIGIAGAGLGSILVNLVASDRPLVDIGLTTVVGGLVGSVIVLVAAEFAATRFGFRSQDTAPIPIEAILAAGESASVEFKSTARWNLHTQTRDERMELAIARTVAGFLNAEGGLLVIGVDDDGSPVGLANDLALMKEPDHDRFELWLNDYLQETLGKPALASVSTRFEPAGDEHVVVVRVEPSDRPVFLDEPGGQRTADFYVRMGNSTRKLLTDEFAEYRQTRWK